ncbi:MAG: hypothetical protein KBB86_01715 [Candidatus Pacebacteria bacterium]|nr:hypothetical protein [Candidatus Paceibacterota bacterium]
MKTLEIKEIDHYLGLIRGENGIACRKMFAKYKPIFEKAPGSKVKHQAWDGGYIQHLCQCMALAEFLYEPIRNIGGVDFSLSDAILILFLHDLEKPFKYVEGKVFHSDAEKSDFIKSMVNDFSIILNEKHLNALKYIHGEGEDYSPNVNIQLPLSAYVHICDVTSARIWHNVKI